MAEKEKRRATTFRTSKGTIVNVQYPDIYISPAFLSTEDVTSPTELREALREALININYSRDEGVVWRYDTAHIGAYMPRLIHPRYAEETPDGTILISDFGDDLGFPGTGRVFEVDRASKETLWSYAVPYPNNAHRLDNGNTMITCGYRDVTAYAKIVEVNQAGQVVWTYSVGDNMYDAVKFGDYVLLTYFVGPEANPTGHLRKILYSTKALVWDMNLGTPSFPTGIQVYSRQHSESNPSFILPAAQGDYLIGDAWGRIMEVRDATQTIVWTYGTLNTKRHAFNYAGWVSSPYMYGSDPGSALMFIPDSTGGRVYAINKERHTVWQYGWGVGSLGGGAEKRPGILLNTPDSVRFTGSGNMLISDSGGGKVVEIIVKPYKIPSEWSDLFYDEQIRDLLTHTSLVAESGWYPWENKSITLENTLNQAVTVQVQGCRRGTFNYPYNIGDTVNVPAASNVSIIVCCPVKFMRITAICLAAPVSGSLKAWSDFWGDG